MSPLLTDSDTELSYDAAPEFRPLQRGGPARGEASHAVDREKRRSPLIATDWGKELYLRRQATVEPVFGQIKTNRTANRFLRRGRSAVRSEWRLLTATHNLLKLHQHRLAPV